MELISISGPILPTVPDPITEAQRAYNPILDKESSKLGLDEMLSRAGLSNYASIIMSDHGIRDSEEFCQLQECDLKLFCRIARDRILLRRLLTNLVRCFILKDCTGNEIEVHSYYKNLIRRNKTLITTHNSTKKSSQCIGLGDNLFF